MYSEVGDDDDGDDDAAMWIAIPTDDETINESSNQDNLNKSVKLMDNHNNSNKLISKETSSSNLIFPLRRSSISKIKNSDGEYDSDKSNNDNNSNHRSFSVLQGWHNSHIKTKKNTFPPLRPNILLTLEILHKIRNSVQIFKPSKSLANLLEDDQEIVEKEIAEIDLVISGGGLKGYFACGSIDILKSELVRNRVKIARVSGTSAGAWAGLFICCDLPTTVWMETYFACKERPGWTIHAVYEEMWELWMRDNMPKDAYLICSGKLFIQITYVTVWGFESGLISEFTSNQDLFEACLASSCIPFMTEKNGLRKFRGRWVIDGGLTNNTPVFDDGLRRQLVLRLTDVEYPWRLLINPLDTCIDVLVIRGAMLMARFLQGEYIESIAWLEKKETKTDLYVQYANTLLLRRIIAPVTILGYVLYRGTGLGELLKMISSKEITKNVTEIVPFNEVKNVFGTNSIKYISGLLFAGLVNGLRAAGLLI